jgi:hypothetical protein
MKTLIVGLLIATVATTALAKDWKLISIDAGGEPMHIATYHTASGLSNKVFCNENAKWFRMLAAAEGDNEYTYFCVPGPVEPPAPKPVEEYKH